MTIAALGAITLDQSLREQLPATDGFKGFSSRFQKKLAKVNKAPWMMATSEDFRYREAQGGSPSAMTSFMHKYMDHVVQLATSNSVVRGVLLRAFSMLVPPTALFQPAILLRVMRQRFGRAGKLAPGNASKRIKGQVFCQAQAQD